MKQKKSNLSLLFALASSAFGFSATQTVQAEDSVVDVQPEVAFIDLGEVDADPIDIQDVPEVSPVEILEVEEPKNHEVVEVINPTSESEVQSFDKDKADTNQQNAPPAIDVKESEVVAEDSELEKAALRALENGEATLVSRAEFDLMAAQSEFSRSVTLTSTKTFGTVYYTKDGYDYYDLIKVQMFEGKWVFCIEPYTQWTTGSSYTPEDLAPQRFQNTTVSGAAKPYYLTQAMIDRSEKIVKYGFETRVPGDTDAAGGAKMYGFIQAMIWEELGWSIISSGKGGTRGKDPNIMETEGRNYEAFKREVEAKIAAGSGSNIRINRMDGGSVSFNGEHVTLKPGQSVTLTDRNGVLEHLDVPFAKDGYTFMKQGNSLIITATEAAVAGRSVEVEMTGSSISRREESGSGFSRPSVLFRRTGAQSFARFNYQEPGSSVLTTTSYSGRVSVDVEVPEQPKTGELTLRKVDDEGRPVRGVTFTIEGPEGYHVTKVVNDFGYVRLKNLPIGEYIVTETNAPAGYIRTSSKRVSISLGDLTPEETIVNERQKGIVEIHKTKEGIFDTANEEYYSLEGVKKQIFKSN